MPSLTVNLLQSALHYPDRPVLRFGTTVLTYAELEERTARVAALLRSRGIEVGARVAVMLPNVPEFVVLYYGILRAGAVVVPMNPLLKTREVAYYLRDSGAALLFDWPDGPGEGAQGAAATETPVLDARALEQLLTQLPPYRQGTAVDAGELAVILYTSGTTGTPKGAALTHSGLAHNAAVYSSTVQDIRADDVILGCLPLFHTFGQTCAMNAAICCGAALTLLPRFDPAAVFETIARDEVTMLAGVPTMYSALLHHPGADAAEVSSLRRCVSGGASLPVELLRAFEKTFGCAIFEGYGLSETSPVVTFNHTGRERKPGSIGTPIRGVDVRLVDLVDGVGEIAVRGPNVMHGYWRRPEDTRAAIPDGWFRTGDLARRDADGYFFIVDRKKDMIIRGGYNVYPREYGSWTPCRPGPPEKSSNAPSPDPQELLMSTFTSSDGTAIHVLEWLPTASARGVVQIAHGMGEYAGRYTHLAERLAALGYAVYANDHRGHGHSITGTPGDLGDNGWNLLVEDMVTLTTRLRAQHPGVPVILFGHSLGSFAVQQYLLDHSDLVDDVVLCGTTAVDELFANIVAAGGDRLALFNREFEPTRTTADWLSRDESQVDAYEAHPWCGFALDPANMALLAATATERLAKPEGIRTDLPVYVMVGSADPLNDGLRLSDLQVQRYRDAGLTDITYRAYPDARHEILNEINREEVENDLIMWITRRTGQR
ncbi:alpha/beta fold hydrolase [Nocardia sp. XZ_19_385]|uniref:alpha/beta fold hydrolase n=1 Tax=Nocardia sp. XZ_19_385 TaxID=2769488 RepID=UPI002815A36C|nr:alpha/beta fold hydrolase [Nocardia sp. XZ_19_385]